MSGHLSELTREQIEYIRWVFVQWHNDLATGRVKLR